jgi:hypothetical protein
MIDNFTSIFGFGSKLKNKKKGGIKEKQLNRKSVSNLAELGEEFLKSSASSGNLANAKIDFRKSKNLLDLVQTFKNTQYTPRTPPKKSESSSNDNNKNTPTNNKNFVLSPNTSELNKNSLPLTPQSQSVMDLESMLPSNIRGSSNNLKGNNTTTTTTTTITNTTLSGSSGNLNGSSNNLKEEEEDDEKDLSMNSGKYFNFNDYVTRMKQIIDDYKNKSTMAIENDRKEQEPFLKEEQKLKFDIMDKEKENEKIKFEILKLVTDIEKCKGKN